jgi:hypothetical protein
VAFGGADGKHEPRILARRAWCGRDNQGRRWVDSVALVRNGDLRVARSLAEHGADVGATGPEAPGPGQGQTKTHRVILSLPTCDSEMPSNSFIPGQRADPDSSGNGLARPTRDVFHIRQYPDSRDCAIKFQRASPVPLGLVRALIGSISRSTPRPSASLALAAPPC